MIESLVAILFGAIISFCAFIPFDGTDAGTWIVFVLGLLLIAAGVYCFIVKLKNGGEDDEEKVELRESVEFYSDRVSELTEENLTLKENIKAVTEDFNKVVEKNTALTNEVAKLKATKKKEPEVVKETTEEKPKKTTSTKKTTTKKTAETKVEG